MKNLVLLLILFGILANHGLAQETLSVTGNAYEGSALFLRVSGSESSEPPTVSMDDVNYSFSPSSDGVWETLLPLSTDSRGRQIFTVTASDKTWKRAVTVKARNYGHQSISLSPTTLAGYDNPRNKADDQAILTALENDRTSRLFQGVFRLPVKAPKTTDFGLRRTYNGWRKGWHKGIDLAGWEGEGVVAPEDGKVIHTASGIVNGNTIVLSHGSGAATVYFHLNAIQVRKGQIVKAGQTIGTVGGTGGFSPHLHWETRVHGVPVNPKVFFSLPRSWRN